MRSRFITEVLNHTRLSISQILLETGILLDRKGLDLLLKKTHLTPFSRHKTLFPIQGITPSLSKNTKVSISASLISKVELSQNIIIGSNSILNANPLPIRIGKNTLIGDSVTISSKKLLQNTPGSVNIGENVFVGDKAVLKSCVVDDGAFIGEGCYVQEGAVVEKGAVLMPFSVVPIGGVVQEGFVWGDGCQILREIGDQDREWVERERMEVREGFEGCDQENLFYCF